MSKNNNKNIDTMHVTIRSVEHFYRIIKTLNKEFGHGKKNWTMPGTNNRVLREFKGFWSTKDSVRAEIRVYDKSDAESVFMKVKLL